MYLDKHLLEVKAWINVANFSDQIFDFDMIQEYMIYIRHLYQPDKGQFLFLESK